MGFLNILSGAYAACALFQIGLFMVGKLQKLTGMLIFIATMLIAAKRCVCVCVCACVRVCMCVRACVDACLCEAVQP